MYRDNLKNSMAMAGIVLVAVLFYGLTLRGSPGNPQASDIKNKLDQNSQPFELSPERGRFVHLLALAQRHTYALDKTMADVAAPDVGYHGNGYFSFFEPGVSYMVFPVFLLGGKFGLSQVFSFGFIALVSILSLLFLYKIGREIFNLPVFAALASVLIFAFGSTAWSYAITLYQHLVTVFFMLSGFYSVYKFSRGGTFSWLWAFFAGAAYALSITIDAPNAILLLPVAVYLIIVSVRVLRERENGITISLRPSALAGFLAFCIFLGLLLYFNQHYLGSWHTLNGALPDYNTASATSTTAPVSALNLPVEKNVLGFFSEESVPRGFIVLLFSRDRGLLVFAPIFLVAFAGLLRVLRQKISLSAGILVSLLAVNVLLYSSWGDPWGGWAYGPRYLIPSMAVLSLFAGSALARNSRRLGFLAASFLLFCYSAAIAALGAVTTNANPAETEALSLHTGYNFVRNWNEFLLRDRSGSFVYNAFFSRAISLKLYYLVLYAALLLVALFIFYMLAKSSHES